MEGGGRLTERGRRGWRRAEVVELSADVEDGGVMVMLHDNMDGQPADRALNTLQQAGYCSLGD